MRQIGASSSRWHADVYKSESRSDPRFAKCLPGKRSSAAFDKAREIVVWESGTSGSREKSLVSLEFERILGYAF